jgi:energy-coupling factor transport system permease protein
LAKNGSAAVFRQPEKTFHSTAMLVSLSYRPRGSIIETFDPRARWIFSILILFSIIQFWDYRFLLFFFLLAVFQYALTRLTFREARQAWILTTIIVASMVIVNTLITSSGTISSVMQGGHPVWGFDLRLPLFGWTIHFVLTVERLWFALCQALRIFAIALFFMVIPFTMDPRLYGVTFKGMGFPDRLAFTMDLAFRFIPTLARDFSVTLDAQRARGYEIERAKGGLIAQIRKVAPLIVPVTMNSILTGEDVVNAMDLRCFGLRPRTWIESLTYHGPDYAMIAFGILLLVGSLVLRYAFGIGDFIVPGWVIPG